MFLEKFEFYSRKLENIIGDGRSERLGKERKEKNTLVHLDKSSTSRQTMQNYLWE